jgi:hypothetical protein
LINLNPTQETIDLVKSFYYQAVKMVISGWGATTSRSYQVKFIIDLLLLNEKDAVCYAINVTQNRFKGVSQLTDAFKNYLNNPKGIMECKQAIQKDLGISL